MTPEERHFWLRRLHSLSGIVPVGGFLAFHLYENYSATLGAAAYNTMTRNLQETRFALALEIAVIIVPLLFHGVYGLFVTGTARPNVISNRYVRNWMYFLQRVTGVILFAFVIFHLWTTRFVEHPGPRQVDLFRLMEESVANPWIYAFYVARHRLGDVPPRQRNLVLLDRVGTDGRSAGAAAHDVGVRRGLPRPLLHRHPLDPGVPGVSAAS